MQFLISFCSLNNDRPFFAVTTEDIHLTLPHLFLNICVNNVVYTCESRCVENDIIVCCLFLLMLSWNKSMEFITVWHKKLVTKAKYMITVYHRTDLRISHIITPSAISATQHSTICTMTIQSMRTNLWGMMQHCFKC